MPETLFERLHLYRAVCLDWLTIQDYSPRTITSYDLVLREFIRWVSAQEELQELTDLTTPVLQNYMIYLSLRASKKTRRGQSKKLMSGAGKMLHVAALLKLFTYLVKRGYLLTNPVHELERPKLRKTIPRTILTVEEMFKLLAGARGEGPIELRNRSALELLYSTAMRRAEMEKLTLESLRLDERLVLVEGKGARERLLPIGEEATRSLLEYLEHGRPKLRSNGSKALFLSRLKGPMKACSLLSFLKKLASEVGITKRVDLHSIRHTCVTHMLQRGADIRYLQELLGHESLKTTQIYTRVEISDLKSMIDQCHPREKF